MSQDSEKATMATLVTHIDNERTKGGKIINKRAHTSQPKHRILKIAPFALLYIAIAVAVAAVRKEASR